MHIPDGYLSPQTYAVLDAAIIPLWAVAGAKVKKTLKAKQVPLLALGAAFSFVIMMFNVPVFGGSTGHAVGATLIAILLGPWAAAIAVSIALVIQALVFGDGGITAIGANVLNMAIIMPFVGLAAYRLLAGRAPLTSRRRMLAAGAAGYAGINAAALAAAIEFGLQPDLFHTADGTPLYSPYHLAQTIPAMMLAHLTVAGAAEAILSAGVLAYLARADVRRLIPNHPGVPIGAGDPGPVDAPARPGRLSPGRVAAGFIALMVVLTPLGLLAPGGAFGEAAPGALNLGALGLKAVPEGLNRYNGFWSHTLLGGYGHSQGQSATLGYWLSAVVGIAVVGLVVFALARLVVAISGRSGSAQHPSVAEREASHS